jgi:hypothetical protein
MYTTAAPESVDQDFQGTDFKAPMAGFGYGLPIARLYAQCESGWTGVRGDLPGGVLTSFCGWWRRLRREPEVDLDGGVRDRRVPALEQAVGLHRAASVD